MKIVFNGVTERRNNIKKGLTITRQSKEKHRLQLTERKLPNPPLPTIFFTRYFSCPVLSF